MNEIINRLKELLAKASEPRPAPVPDQDSRVGEAGAARQDQVNYQQWRERTEAARTEIVNALSALLSALTNLTPSGVERIRAEAFEEAAKIIYEAMRWAVAHKEAGDPPAWVERGNSLAQSEARSAARQISEALALPSEPPSQGDVEGWATLAKRLCEVHAKITPFIESGLSPFQDSFTLEDGNILLDAALALASKEDGRS